MNWCREHTDNEYGKVRIVLRLWVKNAGRDMQYRILVLDFKTNTVELLTTWLQIADNLSLAKKHRAGPGKVKEWLVKRI